ncbi:MAG: L,D-transpeptidase family protein [Pseudomonadota bacterium]
MINDNTVKVMSFLRPFGRQFSHPGLQRTLVFLILATVAPITLIPNANAAMLKIEEDVAGELVLAASVASDTLSDLARAYDQGYTAMRRANPSIDPWLPGEDTEIVVPSRYILPESKRRGLVINVPEMRMYFFPKTKGRDAEKIVVTYPISIGRQQWNTPHGATKIVAKVKDPNWYPPESVRQEHEEQGDVLPKIVPAGPDNPLGAYKLRLGLPGYLIHGTNKPYGIGMRVTHGCIRMYPKDVESLFGQVPVGTDVFIVNQPYKVGLSGGGIYLEVHPHLDEDDEIFRDEFTHVVNLIVEKTAAAESEISWAALKRVLDEKSGLPTLVGRVRQTGLALESP